MPDKYTNPYKLLLISLLGAVFIIYINIAYFPWEFRFLDNSEHLSYILFFILPVFFLFHFDLDPIIIQPAENQFTCF